MFSTGPVFIANYNLTQDPAFNHGGIAINQGGTDSGKTTALVQVLCTIAVFEKPPIDDPIITIVSKSIPDSKKGAYRKFEELVNSNEFLYSKIKDWNRSDRIVYFKSGWIMEFTSYVDEQSAKQGKRQYLFINEAQGISWLVFWQLAKKTRKIVFIDYNPTAPFWSHEKLIGTTKESNDLFVPVKLIISDHRHNPFLSEAEHARTEYIKDPELWNVYARGITGNLSGLIYPNWRSIRDADFPKEDTMFGGLDFGYNNDPTAGVKLVRIANKIFCHELCYEPGLTPQRLHSLYKGVGFNRDKYPVYCEHDGDMIKQLKRLGLYALGARKGPNSVNPGILKLGEYEVYYTESSKNIDYERKKYMWLLDKDTGKPTNEPSPIDNHLMDAIRYGVYTHFWRAA